MWHNIFTNTADSIKSKMEFNKSKIRSDFWSGYSTTNQIFKKVTIILLFY